MTKIVLVWLAVLVCVQAKPCITKVGITGSAIEDGNAKDFDPDMGGKMVLESASDGDVCETTNLPKCDDVFDTGKKGGKQKSIYSNQKCCEKTAAFLNNEMCDGNPPLVHGDAIPASLYYVGHCSNDALEYKNGEKGDRTGMTCGEVQVVEFPDGKMILEYNEGEEPCTGGMFLPFFPGEFMWGITGHTIIFLITMIFSFLGIAIIADVFMAAIEVITSKTKTITQQTPEGEKKIEFLVWNETIANLTLMALGSSAPEILLSVIETLGMTQAEAEPGGLGPGTIVGSAAFNLLVIIAICVMAIPKKDEANGETGVRKIKAMGVFTCTAIFSVFAYIWLFLCVQDNNVSIVEAFITLLFFPLLVIIAYILDKRGAKKSDAVVPDDIGDSSGPTAHVTGTSGMGAMGYGKADLAKKLNSLKAAQGLSGLLAEKEAKVDKRQIADQKKKIAQLAVAEIQAEKKVSPMQAKINARRAIAGRQRVVAGQGDPDTLNALKQIAERKKMEDRAELEKQHDASTTFITFATPTYSVDENKGKVEVEVTRHGNSSSEVSVYYNTIDGEALSGSDFKFTRGHIEFKKGETSKLIVVELIDDSDYEPDESFYVQLKKPKEGKKGTPSDAWEFGRYQTTTVTILNDDKPGTMSFEKPSYSVSEASGAVKIKMKRTQGADGEVQILVKTVNGSAEAGKDFVKFEQTITFKNNQSEHEIEIGLIEDDAYEKEENFSVEMTLVSDGLVRGDHMRSIITIVADEAYATLVNEVAELMALQFETLSLETTTWADQFDEAMNIQGEEGQDASTMDYVMHFLTFGWKVMFATVPPTSYSGGWVTFFVALGYIGVLTAFVADIAGIFGCLLGLEDAVTAITFVALGTSLPDTFASKTAAVNDDTADASVGNVTGSNSVNVFLGLGLPWVLATVINSAGGFTPLKTDGNKGDYPMIAGSLGFSVVIFCICAVVCILTLYVRRAVFGYELGGAAKTPTGIFFMCLWLVYVLMSSLETGGQIESFM